MFRNLGLLKKNTDFDSEFVGNKYVVFRQLYQYVYDSELEHLCADTYIYSETDETKADRKSVV